MPKSEMRVESEYPIPEDTLVPVVLESVEVVEKNVWKDDRKTGETYNKWRWTFKVFDGPYAGIKVRGETQAFISTHPSNLTRIWSEAIRGQAFAEGEGIDTDDLIGARAVLTVKHGKPYERRDGKGTFYPMDIADVYNVSVLDEMAVAPF